jgi:2-amino-4-hydroxy-6-hydroxymethyldihydropteridine diphosphokinase
MILIALGANLPSERFGHPRATLAAALDMLEGSDLHVVARSSWYESAPVPPSGQPWFVNAVAWIGTEFAPAVLLRHLHDVEAALGRVRSDTPNAPRAADLDLLDYNGWISNADDWPRLPHPRMDERAFVLLPLAEVAPHWHHPVTGQAVHTLVQQLPIDQACTRMPDVPGTDSSGRAP